MPELIESVWQYIYSLGIKHNVDPIIFATLYVGSIPPYFYSIERLINAKRKNKPIHLPLISTLLFFILPAIYIIAAGRNVAWWVYAIIAFIVVYGLFMLWRKLTDSTRSPQSTN